MAFAVEKDEPTNPIDVRLFGPKAVVLDAEMPANAIEQARCGRRGAGERVIERRAKYGGVRTRTSRQNAGKGKHPPVVSAKLPGRAFGG
jgi:hypothetical protein